MKKLFALLVVSTLAVTAFAQSPQRMSYQAVVRKTSGELIINQSVGMKISILQGSYTGTPVYVETHTTTTNANGLATIEIGGGTIVTGIFAGLDWSLGPYYIKTETDPTGGTSYTITGTSQILSVPFALYAKTAKTADYNYLTNKPTTLSGYGITDGVSIAGTQTISGTTTFKGTTPDLEESLFDVKNKDGQTIFAVYNEGVRIWVADGAKGTKGGFAVGGFDMTRKYLDVSADSVRIYIDSNPETKNARGGFAVGGFDMTKGITGDYFNVSGRSEAETINGESRVMWYPDKEAFRSGKVLIESKDSVGTNSWASGYNSKAVGDWSQALGYNAIARADYSTAIGKNAIAAKINSFAFGEDAAAKNEESYAIGRGAVASGYRSFAFGSAGIDSAGKVTDVARAIGDYSVAIGQGSQAVGFGGVSMGIADTANGKYSIALGYGCGANEVGSVSLGYMSSAKGNNSIAIGYHSEATEWASTAIGHYAKAKGMFSTAFGTGKALGGYSTALGEGSQSGYGSTAMGGFTVASGDYSTAMGKSSIATKLGSTAMGESTHATGFYSTSMGGMTQASGNGSTAMGESTQATGSFSTSMGGMTQASGTSSTAMGQSTKARGVSSTAMGSGGIARGDNSTDMGYLTIAKPYASLVLGRYNDTTCSVNGSTSWVATDPLFICGNGSAYNSRSNAFAVYKNGNTYIQGNLGIGTSNPSQKLELAGSGSSIFLNSTASNTILFNNSGYAPPAFTTRSVGTKIVLYPQISSSSSDYAFGIEANTLWYSIPNAVSFASHKFYAGTTELMRIRGDGNVGIGFANPEAKMEITVGNGDRFAFYGSTDNTLVLQTLLDNQPLSTYGTYGANSENRLVLQPLVGRVGIGITAPTHVLHINGVGRSTSSTWATSSDMRVKDKIINIENSLLKILQLNPVSYQYSSEYVEQYTGYEGNYFGFLAQEVKNILPELITETSEKVGDKTIEDFLLLNQGELIPVIVGAIKEQQQQIESYKSENNNLKSQLQSLQKEIEQIKSLMAKSGE
jgi:hypothetical protein